MSWIPTTKLPPRGEDFGAFNHSIDVLITDGKDIFVGYLETWADDEYPTQWKQKGRDGWDFNNVTHWMFLPDFPKGK